MFLVEFPFQQNKNYLITQLQLWKLHFRFTCCRSVLFFPPSLKWPHVFICSFLFEALTSVVNFREPKSICKTPELVSTHTDVSHIHKYTHTLVHSALTWSWLLVSLSSWRDTATICWRNRQREWRRTRLKTNWPVSSQCSNTLTTRTSFRRWQGEICLTLNKKKKRNSNWKGFLSTNLG